MRIEDVARKALTAPGYPTLNNQCQKFARMVTEESLGGKPMGEPNPGTAKEAALRLVAEHKAFDVSELSVHGRLQPGDLLYKTVGSGGSGHVGIYLGNNQVAENSSVHFKASGGKDARGIRSLKDFGPYQIVARLQPAKDEVKPMPSGKFAQVKLNGRVIDQAFVIGGTLFAPVRQVVSAIGLGLDVSGSQETGYDLKTVR